MYGKQDKGKDFLQGINAEILEQLTEGGKVNNAVGLAGDLKEIVEVVAICGRRFPGYMARIGIPRTSGAIDEVAVAFTDEQLQGNGEIAGVGIPKGSRLLVAGQIQTLKDFKTGRRLVFVLADYVALSPKAMLQNDVALVGELAYRPKYRETPKGKRITEIYVRTQNMLTSGTCYIPCICWQGMADRAAEWQQGDQVRLLGRCQSRTYREYPTEDIGEAKERRVYEVSVSLVEHEGNHEVPWE